MHMYGHKYICKSTHTWWANNRPQPVKISESKNFTLEIKWDKPLY